ncbi:hypothetical protein HQ576_07855, partial [bacterium]|nr:hypothetical protein [bacterium]
MATAEEMEQLVSAHVLLSDAVKAFEAQLGSVVYTQQDSMPRFGLENKSAQSLQILMAVRVASGLNAAMTLLRDGFCQEVAVLFRTVSDFLLAIWFLEDGMSSSIVRASFQRFVQSYFSQQIRTNEDLATGSSKPWYLPTKKKIAAAARMLGQCGNPDEARRILEAQEELLSGYVHGCYRQVMELYRCGSRHEEQGFLTTGAPESPPMAVCWRLLAQYTR